MPAARILAFARTSRCAIVSSLTRNARATAAVGSEQTVRRVSATCASSASAGWQQVKISRSRSSSPNAAAASSVSTGAAWRSISTSDASCSCFERKAILRRIWSSARRRPTAISQARGLSGGASAQASAAAAKASSTQAAAPATLIRPASAIHRPDRPHLDRTVLGGGDLGGDADRLVQVLGLDQVVAAELFAGLGERAVRGQRLAVADPHRGGGGDRLQPVGRLEGAALDDALGEGAVVGHQLGVVLVGVVGFGAVDQQQVLHGEAPSRCLTAMRRRRP